MRIPPLLALLAWVPAGLYLFRRYPMRIAVIINFVAGWALLPSANYRATHSDFPYWIVATSLPSHYYVTKASITGATCLLGILIFDRSALGRLKLNFWDLPMLLWCTVPLLSAVANPDAFVPGICGLAYQTCSWGVPYLAGRLYFSDTEALRLAAKAFVIAGMFYVPVCLFEFLAGPQLYAHLYGYQPYRWVGAQRYFGYRPIGLLEDGNQLGIWMATSALIAIGLWRYRSLDRILGIPIAVTAVVLFAVTILCQSGGSIVLLCVLLPLAAVGRTRATRALTIGVLLVIVSFATLRLANVVSLRKLVASNHAANFAAHALQRAHRSSFGWRLSQDEKYVGVALDHPILGSGEWDWWKGGTSRPWGLWLLVFGMYGIYGLVAMECLFIVPVVRVIWFPLARSDIQGYNLRYFFAAAILMSEADSLLNGAVIMPLLIVVGALSSFAAAKSPVNLDGTPIVLR